MPPLHLYYYHVRPFIPRRLQLTLRRALARRLCPRVAQTWPILESAGTPPPGWKGWPDGKRFAFVLTHDVESQAGLDKCRALMDLDESLGFRSCFNIVPELYHVDPELRHEMVARGFEVGVHGLHHDGHLFRHRRIFQRSLPKINRYLKEWNSVGFRAPSMLRNLKWIGEFDIEWDSSTFDTDPFEPQSDGIGTIFPFLVDAHRGRKPYVELPYTLPQDSTLFLILGETSPRIWKQKLDWIAAKGGMALINTHPDYMQLGGPSPVASYPADHYRAVLSHVTERYGEQVWNPLPRELSRWVAATPDMVARKSLRRSCMVAYSFYDSDNRVRRYAETLARHGDDVDAIALRQPGQPAESTLAGVRVSHIQARRRDERGQLVYLTRILRFWIKSSAILAWRHFRSPYSLIHVHSVPDFEVFAAWVPKLLGAKIILDIHDIVPEFYASKFGVGQDSMVYRALKVIERSSCGFADHVISANHLWHDVLIRRAVPAAKCTVFLNYVDRAIFYPRTRTRTDDRFILVYPGGLQKHQGLEVAIRAMTTIRRQVLTAELHIYGDGNHRAHLQDLVMELGLQEAVFLRPEVPLHDVPDILANADLGVVPKLAEGFGNEAYSTKILEFMSQGLPVVVSRTRVDAHYFDDKTVRFFTSGDAQAFAQAVSALATSPETRAALVANARALLRDQYWDQRQEEYLGLVEGLRAGAS